MNKVYSCAFLSALDKNTSRVLSYVHVLCSGDEISSSTHTHIVHHIGSHLTFVDLIRKKKMGETDRGRG